MFLLLLLSGQVERNPGPDSKNISTDPSDTSSSSSANLSSIFPCGYCELAVTWENRAICCDSCDVWYHKECVDMGSRTFDAFANTNVAWTCCKCDYPNQDKFFHSYEFETPNSFTVLDETRSSSVSSETFSPSAEFEPTLHSSPIYPTRSDQQKKPKRNWRTMIINCRSLRGKV